jgi:hypothetical protein
MGLGAGLGVGAGVSARTPCCRSLDGVLTSVRAARVSGVAASAQRSAISTFHTELPPHRCRSRRVPKRDILCHHKATSVSVKWLIGENGLREERPDVGSRFPKAPRAPQRLLRPPAISGAHPRHQNVR